MSKKKHVSIPLETRDEYGDFRLMAVAEGYVMARRKGRMPFVVTIDQWIEIAGSSQVVPLRPVS